MFGTLADLDKLIAGPARSRIKLVMDLVVNHTSDEHPWFVESRDPDPEARLVLVAAGLGNGHEPGTPGAEPTNWGSAFSGSAWQYDAAGGEYYLHLFSPSSPTSTGRTPRSARPSTR